MSDELSKPEYEEARELYLFVVDCIEAGADWRVTGWADPGVGRCSSELIMSWGPERAVVVGGADFKDTIVRARAHLKFEHRLKVERITQEAGESDA
jgi:hypothetical protein